MAGIDGLFVLEDRPTPELIADQIRNGTYKATSALGSR